MLKPAVEGGKPTRKDFLVFGKPKITQKEIDEVVKTIKSGWLGTGPKTHQFEELVKQYVGCKYAIALNSCTAGLHLALDVLGVSEGDEIITTPLTFPSTINVIIHHNAKPIFVDVEKNTGNINLDLIPDKITKKTKAIMPVHLYGQPLNLNKLRKLTKAYTLPVIEDAAHAFEAKHSGKKVGNVSEFTAFSFYVTKNLMTGEGGMLTTNNKKYAYEARVRSLHGISKDAWKRYSSSGFSPYETLYPGYKYNMMDLVASFGIHQIKSVDKNLLVRRRYSKMYDKAFKKIEEIETLQVIEDETNTIHSHHLYAILLKVERLKISRNQFIDAMKAENIGTGIHFTPVHLHKYYKKTFNFKKGDFPNAEYIGQRTVSLPLSPSMNKQDIKDVILAVNKIIAYYQK